MKRGKFIDIIITIIGFLFILFGIAGALDYIFNGRAQFALWFCYATLIILGWGVLFKKNKLIVSQLNILAIPMIIWTIDFLYLLITNEPLMGITDYFFFQGGIFRKVITLQHVFTLPLALFVLFYIGIKEKDSWKISLSEGFIFYFISLVFTTQEANINCIYRSCLGFTIPVIPYWITWFVAFILMIFVTNWTLNKLFLRK